MRKLFSAVLLLAVIIDIGVHLWSPNSASAQASTGVAELSQVVSSVSQCAWATGATVTNGAAFCFVNTGVPSTSQFYFALNGSTTWTPLTTAAGVSFTGTAPIVVNGTAISCPSCALTSGVVTSFNGRPGAVQLSKADITGTGITATASVTAPSVTATAPSVSITLQ